MEEKQNWSKKLQEQTWDVLYNMPVVSFTFRPEGCRMKHIDGAYGYITLSDAMKGEYRIHIDDESKEKVEEFISIESLIQAGWAVD